MSELQQVEQPQRRLHILAPGGEGGVDRLPRLYDVQEKRADDKSLSRA
jgi:hypothetical protein